MLDGEFEKDLKKNLYKIWNRMSSGTYFPPAVKAVEIPKPGGTRILGVPTVADRIAQTVVALTLEARTEAIFHDDSYGYRPKRSALQAVERCRQRCWKRDWVLDLDVQKFFDSVDHALMVKAVEANTDQRWVVLYVKRWLVAPLQLPDGTLQQRDRGTPQGSAVSPVLANMFMHYAFDMFLAREFPTVEFETIRGRRGGALCDRAAGPAGMGGAVREDGGASGCGCIPTKPRSCIARTVGGGVRSRVRRLRSWGTRSAPGRHGTRMGRRSRRSCPR